MSPEESHRSSEDLNSSNASLEEDQILESLTKLRLEIFQIETTTGPSKRTICIRDEINRLEGQLAICKAQVQEHAK